MTTDAEPKTIAPERDDEPVLGDPVAENERLKRDLTRQLRALCVAAETLREASAVAADLEPGLWGMIAGWRPRAEARDLAAENRRLAAEARLQQQHLSTMVEALRAVSGLTGFDPRHWTMVADPRAPGRGEMRTSPGLRRLVVSEMCETARGFAEASWSRWRNRFNLRELLVDIFVAARRERLRPMRVLRLLYEIRLVRASGLIDSDFYAGQKARTPIPGFDDARNYVLAGRDLAPNRLFDGASYLRLNPDVRTQPFTPLAHFIRFGHAEGRLVEPPVGEGPLLAPVDPETRPLSRWPVAEGARDADLGPYDRRPDDAVLVEARAGKSFLDRHRLLGASPDFAGAVRELQGVKPSLAVVPAEGERPQVSIVIPVYGQLAYTLNCLQALLAHASKYSVEILVGDDASPDESGRWLPQIPHIRHLRHASNLGFVGNCNATAALARGDHIVLLNNDTRVVEGWLDALIDSFALLPDAGLVGSKLLYEDGSLQEAGGIIWRDGSAWNYGRDDDPNRPRYCHAREVDYVSGASIAVPAGLWRELGGFDELYRPAYCEDSDLAFRVRAMGLKTWMQPQSRVIHYEGRTSGTDVTQGVKAYQVENSTKLAARWAEVIGGFRSNGEAPYLERERKVQKRVLVIDSVTPTPNQDAGSVTSVTHMQLYQELGYKVYFAPLDNFLFQPEATGDLQRLGIECLYAPYVCDLEGFLRVHGRDLDAVHVFRVNVAVKALDAVRRYAPQAPVVFANMDMHYLRMERQAAAEGDAGLLCEANEMKAVELGLIASVDCSIIHSPVEADLIHAEIPRAEIVLFPFITPLMGTTIGYEGRSDVTFLGGYRHTPNIDAAVFLAREVWPLVRTELPGVRLVIAGAHPTSEVKALAGKDIVVTGMVEDLRPCFDQTRVFAAAIRYGAGVKGKVATAMSYGVPVVATTIAAEGMFLQDGRDVVIADDPAEFAKAVVRLHRDAEAWTRLSQASLAFVAEMNSMAAGRRLLTEAVERAGANRVRREIEETREILEALVAIGR